MMRISEVAKEVGLGIETIRFYERMGLIEIPHRSSSGYRQYTISDIRRLAFIKRGKTLGFTLNEIKNLLSLRLDPKARCEDVRKTTQEKIAEVESKIKDLQKMKRVLGKLVKACDGQVSVDDCPILEAFDKRGRM